MALKMKTTASIDAPAQGSHMGRIVGIVDLDHQPGYTWDGGEVEAQYKVQVTYELPGSLTKEGKPHWIHEEFKISGHERSTMYKRVTTIDPTGELTSKGQNLAGLLNAPCMVDVGVNKKGYPKINNVTGVPVGIPVGELVNSPFAFDFETPDLEVYRRLPEFIQNKLKASIDFDKSKLKLMLLENGDGEEESNEDIPF